MRQPCGERIAQLHRIAGVDPIGGPGGVAASPRDESGLHGGAWLRVVVLVVLGILEPVRLQVHEVVGIGPEHLGEVALLAAGALRESLDAAGEVLVITVSGPEERGHAVEVLLRPVGERVIVALRAGHIGPEECRQEIRDAVQRHLGIPQQEARRAVVAQFAIGRQHVPHQRVPRPVHGDLSLQPVLVEPCPRPLPRIVLHPQHVREPVEHVHRRTRRVQQGIDQERPLVRTRVCQKGGRFRRGRNATRDVEVHAAHKDLVGHWRVRLPACRLERPLDGGIESRGRLLHHLASQGLARLQGAAGFRVATVVGTQHAHGKPHHRPVPPFHGDNARLQRLESGLDTVASAGLPCVPLAGHWRGGSGRRLARRRGRSGTTRPFLAGRGGGGVGGRSQRDGAGERYSKEAAHDEEFGRYDAALHRPVTSISRRDRFSPRRPAPSRARGTRRGECPPLHR